MAKFIYRMQNILDIKYKLEEQAKQEYMAVQARLNEEQDKLHALEARKAAYFAQRKIHPHHREQTFQVFLQELNQEEMKEIDQLISYQYNHGQEQEE